MTTPLPRTITNVEGRLGTVSDNVLKSGLNIIGCDQANIMGMYATILEPFLDAGGRAILVGDNNHVAGLSVANPDNPDGSGYDVITLGHGNKDAAIHKDDGALIAELALQTDKSVSLNLAGLDRLGVREFLHDFANAMSRSERPQRIPTLLGYTEQSRHFLRQHTGSTKTTRETQFMNGRLREQNIRQMNAVGALQDVPIEFNQSIDNIVAMVQTSVKGRMDLARHLGAPHRTRVLAEQTTSDCGLAYSGVDHGSYFNPSDLDPLAPYILLVAMTRSHFGTAPDPERKISAATRDFMKKLKDARQARKEASEKAETARIANAAAVAEKRRLVQQAARTKIREKAGKARTKPKSTGSMLPPGPLINRMIEAEVPAARSATNAIINLFRYDDLTGIRLPADSIDSLIEHVKTPEMMTLLRKAIAIAHRTGVFLYGAWAVAYAALSQIDQAKADAFFDQFLKGADQKSCGQILQRRLNGLTDGERTTHRALDYTFQAWSAFASGRKVERFVDNDEVFVHHAEIVEIDMRRRATAKAA